MKHRTLTRKRAVQLLAYDRKTGILRRRPGTYRAGRNCPERIGTVNKDGYLVVKIDGHVYIAHRLIFFMETGRWPDPTCDHKNRRCRDNRWSNLREASHLVQTLNRSITRSHHVVS